jgi:hypothetical protein
MAWSRHQCTRHTKQSERQATTSTKEASEKHAIKTQSNKAHAFAASSSTFSCVSLSVHVRMSEATRLKIASRTVRLVCVCQCVEHLHNAIQSPVMPRFKTCSTSCSRVVTSANRRPRSAASLGHGYRFAWGRPFVKHARKSTGGCLSTHPRTDTTSDHLERLADLANFGLHAISLA